MLVQSNPVEKQMTILKTTGKHFFGVDFHQKRFSKHYRPLNRYYIFDCRARCLKIKPCGITLMFSVVYHAFSWENKKFQNSDRLVRSTSQTTTVKQKQTFGDDNELVKNARATLTKARLDDHVTFISQFNHADKGQQCK